MNCQNLEENLPLLLYGELSSSELAACQEHLAECAHCRAAREKLEQFHQLLALRPQVEASPALLAESLPRRHGCDVRAALCDGEDYELLFAVAAPADRAAFERAWRRAFPRTRLSCLGRFVRRGQLPRDAIDLDALHGYGHLSASR